MLLRQTVAMDSATSPMTTFIITLFGFVIMAGIAWPFALWRKVNAAHAFPQDSRLKWLVAAYPLILAAQYLGMKFYPVPSDPLMTELFTQWSTWQLVIVTVVAAPLAEEYLFRGVLLVWLRRHIGEFGSAVITALGWAALHVQYDFIWMGAIAASGILLAYIRMRGGSLWLVIGIHAANNAIAITGV